MEVKRSHKEMTLIKCICKKKKKGGLDMINNGLFLRNIESIGRNKCNYTCSNDPIFAIHV